MINTILIPIIKSEIPRLVKWIEKCPHPGSAPFFVYISIDRAFDRRERDLIGEAIDRSSLRDARAKVYIDCEIAPDQSFYQKDKGVDIDIGKFPYGKKSGPNIQFFKSIRFIQSDASSSENLILLELDAYPVKESWLTLLNCRANWLEKNALVAGSHPRAANTTWLIRNHLNGNAIYYLKNPLFNEFFQNWEQTLKESLRINPDLAYDVVLEWAYNWVATNWDSSSERMRQWKRDMDVKYRYRIVDISGVIVNLSGAETDSISPEYFDSFDSHYPNTLIVHGRYFQDGNDLVEKKFWE